MTFYQELQLNQAGSKSYISSFQKPKDKWKHTGIYFFKILLNIAFCSLFIALFCILFGTENSSAGLAVLLSIMVFRNADLVSGPLTAHSIFSSYSQYWQPGQNYPIYFHPDGHFARMSSLSCF